MITTGAAPAQRSGFMEGIRNAQIALIVNRLKNSNEIGMYIHDLPFKYTKNKQLRKIIIYKKYKKETDKTILPYLHYLDNN